jgi:phage-related protein
MDITLISLASGKGFNLYAVVENRSCAVKEFIENLDEVGKTQIIALFQRILTHGLLHDEKKFRDLEDGIYELKTRSGIRVLCFFGGKLLLRSLVLTHGFPKSKKNVLGREITKARALYNKYKNEALNIVN